MQKKEMKLRTLFLANTIPLVFILVTLNMYVGKLNTQIYSLTDMLGKLSARVEVLENTPPIIVYKSAPPTQDSTPSFSQQDIELLSKITYTEARGESYGCKLAVASAVLNRVTHPKFPNTLKGVAESPNQFDFVLEETDSECTKAAEEVLSKGSILPEDVVYFYANYVSEDNWIRTRRVYKIIDTTIFASI